MKTLTTILMLLVGLCASSALAQIDPDPDGVGIYTSSNGAGTHLDIAPGVGFDLYVVLTRPSWVDYGACLTGFKLTLGLPPNVVVGGWRIPSVCENMLVAPDFWASTIITNGTMLNSATVLVELQSVVVTDGEPAPFYIRPLAVPPFGLSYNFWYWGDGSEAMHPSSGSENLPVFIVNGDAPVPNESVTWGEVKALYR